MTAGRVVGEMKHWKHYEHIVNEILPKRVEAIRKQLKSHESQGIASSTVNDLHKLPLIQDRLV